MPALNLFSTGAQSVAGCELTAFHSGDSSFQVLS